VPPAADVQLHRQPVGEVWSLADSAPGNGLTGGITASAADGLIYVEGRQDDALGVLMEATGHAAWSKGGIGLAVDAPIRAIWDGQAGLAPVRASAIWSTGGVVARLGAVSPSYMSWPNTWSGWRADGSASLTAGRIGLSAGGSWGADGPIASATAGLALWEGVSAEAAWSHSWTALPLGRVEAGLSGLWHIGRLTLRPAITAGLGAMPGTPRLRAILDVSVGGSRREPTSSQILPAVDPVVPITPPAAVEPPAPSEAPAAVEEPIAPPPSITTDAPANVPPADEGWRPFPPTTPDVPAFSIPIVEVDPPVAPAYRGVSQVSGVLTSNPQILLVEIRVHAECGSGRAAALRASQEAAGKISEFLTAQGIRAERVRMAPMGCTAPLRYPEVTAADRAANRRIEVVVLEVGDPAQK